MIKVIFSLILMSILFSGCSSDDMVSMESNHLSLLDCEIYIEEKVGQVTWNKYKANQGHHFGKIRTTNLTARL